MAFIDTISAARITGDAFAMYEHLQAHHGYVPSYATVFCYRPEVMQRWGQLLASIKRPMDRRQFELATFAAAQTLHSTLCSVAHGKALLEFFPVEDVLAMARGETPPSLTAAEAAMMSFARAVARDASAITQDDIAELKQHGFGDAEAFDIAATAAGRAFFSKIIEALGAATDPPARALDPELRRALSVGRPIEFVEPERLTEREVRAVGRC